MVQFAGSQADTYFTVYEEEPPVPPEPDHQLRALLLFAVVGVALTTVVMRYGR